MSSYNKRKFWINRPHEGPEEYEFQYTPIEFSDGLTRFICKSEDVPKDYWPRTVVGWFPRSAAIGLPAQWHHCSPGVFAGGAAETAPSV